MSGCSSNPNYNKVATCGTLAPLCVVAVGVEDLLFDDGRKAQKCSDLPAEKRRVCEEQVKPLKQQLQFRLSSKNKLDISKDNK